MTKKYDQADLDILKGLINTAVNTWNTAQIDVTVPSPLTIKLTPGDGAVKCEWFPNPTKTLVAITDGRNGNDKNGYGPYSTTEAAGGSPYRVFNNLVPGTSYTFTVVANYSDLTSETVTGTAVAGGTPPVVTPPLPNGPTGGSGLTWTSGVWGRNDSGFPGFFGTKRGAPVKVIGVFPERGNGWAGLANLWWANDPALGLPAGFIRDGGTISVGMPLWPEAGSGGLGSATTAEWKAIAESIKSVDPTAHIRLGHEMNLNNGWHITPSNRTAWITEWKRAADIFLSVSPFFRLWWNPNAGGDQTGVDSRAAFQQVKTRCYGYGIDSYDIYPPASTPAGQNTHLTGFGMLGESYNYAVANGVKFGLPEWGVCSGTAFAGNQGGDDPAYINLYMNFLRSKPASTIGYDCYFSETQDYLKSDLFEGRNPNASAAYKLQVG